MPRKLSKHNGVTAKEKSGNIKIGVMSATYVSQASCPQDCPWLQPVMINGEKRPGACYANNSAVAITTARLNREATGKITGLQLAKNEAAAIDGLSGKRVLRLHVVGDCISDKQAQIVSGASAKYTAKHDQPVYSYTHAHDRVARDSWGEVSVLASCHTFEQADAAMKRGYAAAIVVPEPHKSPKAYQVSDITVIPCPQQTGASATCLTCKLCFRDKELLARKAVIAFQPDNKTAPKIKQALIQIQMAH